MMSEELYLGYLKLAVSLNTSADRPQYICLQCNMCLHQSKHIRQKNKKKLLEYHNLESKIVIEVLLSRNGFKKDANNIFRLISKKSLL